MPCNPILPTVLFFAQLAATLLLLKRLLPGRTRKPPVDPSWTPSAEAAVSIIIPTLDEARKIRPLLEGVVAQGDVVREIIFVDSG